MQTLVKNVDGFKVAEVDLKLRGPGDIFGTKQSGFPELKFVNLIEDIELIINTKKIAFTLINNDPGLKLPDNNIVRINLTNYYSENLKYAEIA